MLDGQLCGSGHGAGLGSRAGVCVCGAGSKAEDGAPGTAAAGSGRVSGAGKVEGACRAAAGEPLPKQRRKRVGVKLDDPCTLPEHVQRRGGGGEPFCTFQDEAWLQTRAGRRPVGGCGTQGRPSL